MMGMSSKLLHGSHIILGSIQYPLGYNTHRMLNLVSSLAFVFESSRAFHPRSYPGSPPSVAQHCSIHVFHGALIVSPHRLCSSQTHGMLVCPSGFDQLVRIQRKSRSLFADALVTQRARDVHTLSNAMIKPWLQALLMELVLAVEGGDPLLRGSESGK
jgi:hypothetical protein